MATSHATPTNPGLQDLTGQRFGRWVVVGPSHVRVCGKRHWVCRCDCGQSGLVTTGNLHSGTSQSCGCLTAETASRRRKHGASKTPELSVWRNMIRRCHNPGATNYKDYGGRGIAVCGRWRQSFAAFLADVGPRPSPGHSIDRIDVNGGYEPGNCRWATRQEQARNRRDNVWITWDGVTRCLTEWAEITGLKAKTIEGRLARGVPVRLAMTLPKSNGSHPRTSNRLLTYKGVTHCLEEWARLIGINPTTLGQRLGRGWSVAKALRTPKLR